MFIVKLIFVVILGGFSIKTTITIGNITKTTSVVLLYLKEKKLSVILHIKLERLG